MSWARSLVSDIIPQGVYPGDSGDWAHLIRGPIHAGFEIEVQVNEGSVDEYQRHVVAYF
jgi:hypothetical protein